MAAPKNTVLETTTLQPSPPLEVQPVGRPMSQSMAEMQPAGARAAAAAQIITELPEVKGTVQDAAALLGAFQADRRQVAKQIASTDDDKYQYYVRCRRHDQPGIFLRKNPHGGTITVRDWFASYKSVDEPWGRDVWCQHCLEYNAERDEYSGVQFPLAGINYAPTKSAKNVEFHVESRYLFRYAKDPELFRQMAEKGIALHRGVRMAADAMNHGLPADVVTREVQRAAV